MSFVQTHKMCLNLFKQQFHARAELDRVCQQVFSEFQQKKSIKFINMINNKFNLRFMSLPSHIHIILDFIGIEK